MRNVNYPYIDLLKVISAMTIVLLHTSSISYSFYSQDSLPIERLVLKELWYISRFAVPVFVMITGFLLLQKDKIITWEIAIKKYSFRMIIVLLTIGLCFTWLETIFDSKEIAISQLPDVLYNLSTGQTWDHLWYLYMLIGLYLVLPVVKAFTDHSNPRETDIALVILCLFTIILPFLQTTYGFEFSIKLPVNSAYLFYLLLGYRIGTTDLSGKAKYILPFLSTVLISSVILVWYQEESGKTIPMGYESPQICLLSASIFSLFTYSTIKREKTIACLKKLSALSFGVYVFHPLWLNIITKLFHFNPLSYHMFSMTAVFVLVIILSLITTVIYRKIPYIGKYI